MQTALLAAAAAGPLYHPPRLCMPFCGGLLWHMLLLLGRRQPFCSWLCLPAPSRCPLVAGCPFAGELERGAKFMVRKMAKIAPVRFARGEEDFLSSFSHM